MTVLRGKSDLSICDAGQSEMVILIDTQNFPTVSNAPGVLTHHSEIMVPFLVIAVRKSSRSDSM